MTAIDRLHQHSDLAGAAAALFVACATADALMLAHAAQNDASAGSRTERRTGVLCVEDHGHVCRYVRAGVWLLARSGGDVLYCGHQRGLAGMARSRAAGEPPSDDHARKYVVGLPVTGDTRDRDPARVEPMLMSVRFLVLVFTSIVDTESPRGKPVRPRSPWVTKAVLPSG